MVFMAVQYHQYCLNRLKMGFNKNCIYDCGAINTKYKKIPTRRTEHLVVVVILHNYSWQFVCNKMEGCETDKGLIINCLLKCILLKKACHSLSKFIFYFYRVILFRPHQIQSEILRYIIKKWGCTCNTATTCCKECENMKINFMDLIITLSGS